MDLGPVESLASTIYAAFAEASESGFGIVHHDGEPFDARLFDNSVKVIGSPIRGRGAAPGIDILRPTEEVTAPLRSLSKIHGLGSFPFHTDGAHWNQPPKWLVLACQNDTEQRATTLLPAKEVLSAYGEEFRLNEALFLVVNGRNSFYTPLVLSEYEGIRYDGGCMKPVNSTAKLFVKEFDTFCCSLTPTAITWRPGLIAVINNHRFLHSRASGGSEGERTLYRALI